MRETGPNYTQLPDLELDNLDRWYNPDRAPLRELRERNRLRALCFGAAIVGGTAFVVALPQIVRDIAALIP